MSLNSRKAPTHFGTVTKSGKISPGEVADIIYRAATRLGIQPTVKLISEGLGTIEAESNFDPKNPGDGTHIGLWMEESSFGPVADRLDAEKSTIAALRRWKADGGTYKNGWTDWEHGETEGTGIERAPKYRAIANAAIQSGGGASKNPSLGEEIPIIGGVVGDVEGAISGAASGVESAEQFLQQLAETILDFRSLGNLAASAFAWMMRLIAKAFWDYVIAPVVHWSERAVEFYWVNFFGAGTERGSGFGYQLRNNAGAITVLFWSMGYAILWSDGTSMTPVPAHESLFGQGVKQVEGAIARRNLVKPGKVKEKTPTKPKPVETKVPIERRQTYSVARKRPVSVHSEGRNRVSNQRLNRPVPRPTPKPEQSQKLLLPAGIKQEQRQNPPSRPAKQGGPRMGPRGTRNHRS